MGSSCTTIANCFPKVTSGAGYGCIGGVCTYIGYPGDSCTNSTQCGYALPCNNSICSAPTQGQSCSTSGICSFGLSCQLVNASMICVPKGKNGTSCSNGNPCYPGYYCHSGKCTSDFSVGSGGGCFPQSTDECSSGFICVSNGTCITAQTSLTSCTASANCSSGQLCVCSEFSGKQFCVGENVDPCTDQYATYMGCINTNNCSSIGDAPNSCSYKNCYSDFKKANSCACTSSTDVFGTCFYSPYCGGFPVWAIIVIIIVIIVLILAVVLVVFFLMRRRRQYDSI